MKKIYIIILISVVIITILLIFKFNNAKKISNNNTNNTVNEIIDTEEEIIDNLSATRKTVNNYEKSQNIVLAKVNDYEISEKYLCITEFFYSDINDLLKKEIENIVLLNLAKENNLTLEAKEQQYINDVAKGLREDFSNSDIFEETNISQEEYLQLIKEYMEKISLIFEYRSFITEKMQDGTLEIEDKKLKKEYEDYFKEYTEWKEDKNIGEYKEISDYEEEILQKYIEHKVSQAEVEIY